MTTRPTRDQVPLEMARQQFQGLIPNDALPAENQKGNKRSQEHKEIQFLVSPFQNYPDYSNHIIEATTKVSEHGEFKVGRVLLTEHIGERRITYLPENGIHDHTNFFSQGSSSIGLQPLQRMENPGNVYFKKTSLFLVQLNLNPSNLKARSLIGSDIPSESRNFRPIFGLPTTDFDDLNDPNQLINMNDVFGVQDESDI